ncbi:unnamed protein product [Mytilus coruscus]|uniref:CARD domain-containing protein n=1 Tax=Mytilus coruscus TaxID=42192 RepID=A0A6J8B6X9_MYTCO|nr:unnamed protein product [Mytilus coruscus]
MNSEDEEIMIKLHQEFMDYLDAKFLVDFLYKHKVLTVEDCNRIINMEPVSERTRELLFLLPRIIPSLDLFYYALNKCGYDFLAVKMKDSNMRINRQHKCRLFGTHRYHLVNYRHELKRLTHSGKHDQLREEINKMRTMWEMAVKVNFKGMTENDLRGLADRYFYALDADCEFRRVIFDKTFVESDLFQRIRDLSKYTSEVNIPNMLCSARYGSAIFMANQKDFEKAHGYIKEAKQRFCFVKACRETGVVLYIEYNMFNIIYSDTMQYNQREHLLDLGRQAIDHFQKEKKTNPEVAEDFLRMFSLKLAHLYLGIGLFGDYLKSDVPNKYIEEGKRLLKTIKDNKQMWERMEVRWEWFYYTAQARISYLENCPLQALEFTKHALSVAEKGKGNNQNEIKSSKDTITYIEDKISSQQRRWYFCNII